jgi:uncharacterized protein DUF2490
VLKFYYTYFIIVFLVFTTPFLLSGQNEVNTQIWTDIALFNEYSRQLDLYADFGYRINFQDEVVWNRFYIRPSLKYSPISWLGIRGGANLVYTKFPNKTDILELRPWQGISVGWPNLPRMKFSSYLRLEERIYYDTETWDKSLDLRLRYKLSTRLRFNYLKKSKYFYLPAFVEVFANEPNDKIEEDTIAVNNMRLSVGIGYAWNKYWSGQFVTIFQKSRNEALGFETSDLIFNFSLRHELVPLQDTERLGN